MPAFRHAAWEQIKSVPCLILSVKITKYAVYIIIGYNNKQMYVKNDKDNERLKNKQRKGTQSRLFINTVGNVHVPFRYDPWAYHVPGRA